jgi:hypothetical protein
VSDRASSNLHFPDRLGAAGCDANVAARRAPGYRTVRSLIR